MELPTKFFRDKIWVSIVIAIVAILGFLAELLGFLESCASAKYNWPYFRFPLSRFAKIAETWRIL